MLVNQFYSDKGDGYKLYDETVSDLANPLKYLIQNGIPIDGEEVKGENEEVIPTSKLQDLIA